MPYIIVDKNLKGFKIVPFENGITIGRGTKNDIILNQPKDASISRRHAIIDKAGQQYILHDTSVNGTVINGERIERHPLTHGDRFHILDYSFTFIEDAMVMDQSFGHATDIMPPGPENATNEGDPKTLYLPQQEDRKPIEKAVRDRLQQVGIIAESNLMLDLFQDVEEIAQINVPVLILGPHGCGKEKIAQALHALSRTKGSFIALNCSAIPEGIFESELFGSVKGAYHGATDKPGKIEQAENGTIFLDEIGDMGLALQPKLLRFLEQRELTRLGDTRVRQVNVRVIAATNQNLKKMMEEKKFRPDLYQRLACIKLQVPALHERKEDILPLVNFFLEQFAREHDLQPQKISTAAIRKLMVYNWPGNVRELHNVLIAAAVKSRKGIIQPEHLTSLPEKLLADDMDGDETFFSLQEMEKYHIRKALQVTGGNRAKAARMLGISRDTLYKKIEKYDIGAEQAQTDH